MTEWVRVRELLDLQIPRFPKSKPGLLKRAQREGWRKREVTTRGGTAFEFELSSLPVHIQEALLKKRSEKMAVAFWTSEKSGLDALPAPKKRRALARFWVLEELRRFEKEHGQGYRSKRRFCELLNSGEIPVPEEHRRWLERRGKLHLSPQTLYRWQKRYDEWGTWGLVDGYGKRKDRSKIDSEPEVRDFIAAQIAKFPHVKPRVLWQLLQVEFPWFEVSEATIRRYLQGLKEGQDQRKEQVFPNREQWEITRDQLLRHAYQEAKRIQERFAHLVDLLERCSCQPSPS